MLMARTSHILGQSYLLADIQNNNRKMLATQKELASGYRINVPSDDPVGGNIAISFQAGIEDNEQFGRNISQATSKLSAIDSVLREFSTLNIKLREILTQLKDDGMSDPTTRTAAAVEVNQMLAQIVELGNYKFGGQYLFSGSNSQVAPFALTDSYVQYRGDESENQLNVGLHSTVGSTMTGAHAFGALSARIEGTVDLNANITYGGENGTGAAVAANTLTDTNLIGKGENLYEGLYVEILSGANAGNVRLVTGFNSATGNVTFAGPAMAVDASTDYVIRGAATKLDDMNRGQGVDKSAITIQDGFGAKEIISLEGAHTIRDVIDRINGNTKLQITAGLNAAGNGIELTAAAGGDISVTEFDNGTAARDLGIYTAAPAGVVLTGTDLDPLLSESTSTGLLNGGAGIDLSSGLTIINGTTSRTVDISQALTIQDIFNTFEQAGVYIKAEVNSSRTGMDIINTLNGARLQVLEGAGTTAADLGIEWDFTQTKLTDLNGGNGVEFTEDLADFRIHAHDGTDIDIDITTINTVQDLVNAINAHPANGGKVTASIGPADNIVLTDNTVGADDFQTEELNGQHTIQGLKLFTNAGAGNTITGGDLNPAGLMADSLFSILITVRDALQTNDKITLENIWRDHNVAETSLHSAIAEIGGRVHRMDLATSHVEDMDIMLRNFLAEVREVDWAETIARFQSEQVVLQAAMQTSATIMQMSIFNYI